MRSLAWLYARPKPAGTSAKPPPNAPPPPMRLQRYIDNGTPLPLPYIGGMDYLVEALFEVGPVSHAGMGAVQLTWQDLQGWQRMTGTPLQPWEARTLRTLSGDYLRTAQDAESPACPAPWLDPEAVASDEARKATAQNIRSVLRS